MSSVPYALALAISLVGAVIAVIGDMRLRRPVLSMFACGLTFGLVSIATARFLTGHWPPWPWDGSNDFYPWERLVLSLFWVGLSAPFLAYVCTKRQDETVFWLSGVGGLVLLATLPTGDSYQDMIQGNAAWAIGSLLAIGLNVAALHRLDDHGGGRWLIWIPLAFLSTVSAVLLSCYASLGEYSLCLTLSTLVFASIRSCVKTAHWQRIIGDVCIIAGVALLAQVRIYSSQALSGWSIPIAYGLPALVVGADRLFVSNKRTALRIATAAIVSALLGFLVLLPIFGSASDEQW